MAERFKQLKEFIQQQKDLFQSVTISDYLFIKCLLFAKVTLPEDEFRLYQRLFDIIHQQLVQPDILIYLHAPVNRLQANIRKRNRPYEQNIPDDYLFNIQETYTHYIKQHNTKTLFVDASEANFLGNEKHVQAIIDALDKEYTKASTIFHCLRRGYFFTFAPAVGTRLGFRCVTHLYVQ
jgi:deoxyadenosine/deoxycytidine kinase